MILGDEEGPFESDSSAAFVVDIEGYEGPLDVLLALAREQKVDLRQISILQLADQYLAFVSAARRVNLQLAAEYLVIAAWLAYLKSRLLLPESERADEPSADDMAAQLALQLRRLEAMRTVGARLLARAQLGREVFARGCPEVFEPEAVTVFRVGLADLLKAYGHHLSRKRAGEPLRIEASSLWSVDQALERLSRMVGGQVSWENLVRFLPPGTFEGLRQGRIEARSQLAATFAASLELARRGAINLRQSGPFGAIYVRAAGQRGEKR